jgi:hypothetical protein
MNSIPKAIILSEGYTATSDYYLVPYLEKSGYCVSLFDYRQILPTLLAFPPCQLIVISRYISNTWLKILAQLASHQSLRIIYFMDDDLFDWQALAGLPLGYRWKIITKALIHQQQLTAICHEFWLSTPYLMKKYSHLNPVLISPMFSAKTLERKKAVYVCYHGTASHQSEIEWLLPIITAVQSRSDNIHFELFGSRAIAKAVNKCPRVSVLHSMSWSNYLDFTSGQKRDIALAPLLSSRFNAARAATKFYDYARLGAVGLYSNAAPYKDFIHDGIDGFLLDNDPNLWVEKILQISNNSSFRESLLINIEQRAFNLFI